LRVLVKRYETDLLIKEAEARWGRPSRDAEPDERAGRRRRRAARAPPHLFGFITSQRCLSSRPWR
jgi:hypothetical protein